MLKIYIYNDVPKVETQGKIKATRNSRKDKNLLKK